MRRAKNKSTSAKIMAFGPKSLRRQEATRNQIRHDEDTILWGSDDAFPLKLAKMVEDSPAATACIGTITKFIRGAGFSNHDLMSIKVDSTGRTLWELHCELSGILSLFDGFSLNFKFSEMGKITNAYIMPFESVRFVKPNNDLARDITHVKYNPYFGTAEYKKEFSKEYPLFDLDSLSEQISELGTRFQGQVYYCGSTKPIHRFYPHPDYWSAEKWIYVDGKIQESHAENMDNGFFQSTAMTIVGDPDAPSRNPKYKEEYIDANGQKRIKSTKTQGEEFSEQMASTFSGASKMGTMFVRWVLNRDDAVPIEPFQTNTNADLFLALQDLTTKNITIAFKVPGILANISEGVNLGSTGNEIQKAVELMQSVTHERRSILENFYNNVLIPNLDENLNGKIKDNVEIVNFNPVTVPVEIDDKFWEVLSQEERREFIRKNIPGITLIDPVLESSVSSDPLNPEPNTNEIMKNLTGRQLEGIQRIIRKFNKDQLSFEQAKTMLQSGFNLTDEQVDIFLVKEEEENDTANTLILSK